MKKISVVIISLLLVLMTGISSWVFGDTPVYNYGYGQNTTVINPNDKSISIAFTHDTHSHLETQTEIKNGKVKETGGAAKEATIFKEIASEHQNSFIFDAGDFSMGTGFQTIFKKNASELRTMGLMGYDAVTFGNHEFDYGANGLAKMLNAAMESGDVLPQIVTASIDWEGTFADKDMTADGRKLKDACDRYGVKDYTVIEKNGIKVGVFGILGQTAISYSPNAGVKFLDPVTAAKKAVDEIKANETCDMIVCLSHSGTDSNPDSSEDEILANAVDGIDFIVSGHTHTTLEEPIITNNVVIGSVGQYTYNVGNVTFTKKSGEYDLDEYKLIPVNQNIRDDWEVSNKVAEFKTIASQRYFSLYGYSMSTILTKNTIDFTPADKFGREQGEDGLGNLLSDSLIYGVKKAEGKRYEKVDVAIVAAGVVFNSLPEGNITVGDAFSVLPLGVGYNGMTGYPLVSAYLTGSEIRTLAEVDISISDIMNPARLYMSGVKYTYNPNRLIMNRISDITIDGGDNDGAELEKNKLYRVVADSYACQMMSVVEEKSHGLLSVVPKDREGNPMDMDNLQDYLVKKSNGKEVKEWWAVTKYLESFNGKIPAKYGETQGRKVLEDSKSLKDLIKNPNRIFCIAAGVVVLILAVVALVIVLLVRLITKNSRRRRAWNKNQPAPIFSNRKNKYKSKWKL